jgi:hypothetical protein
MSKYHVPHARGVMMNEIFRLSYGELEDLYGIEIDEDTLGVFDPTENKHFPSLEEWAKYLDDIEADDNYSKFTKIGSRQPFDDDY